MSDPMDNSVAVLQESCAAPLGPRTIFDLLNEISLQNIIRHVSKCPRRMDWASFLSPNDAIMLYTMGGKLTDVAKKMFTQISVWRYFTQNKQGEYYNYHPQELCLNLQLTDSNVFAQIMAEADQYPSLLAFLDLPTTPLTCRLWSNLSTRIEPIRALHILGAPEPPLFDSVLAAVGPRLRTLGVRCDKPYFVDSIARHCSGIVELTLYERHVDLAPIWYSIGPSLRVLTFEEAVQNSEVLKSIQTRCRALIKLDLYAEWEKRKLNPSISDLYSLYGEQLQFANLYTMEPWDYRRVVDSCPNVKCAASFTEFSEEGLLVKEGLESVGPALSIATISFADDRVMTSGLAEAANMCRNLRELKIDDLKLDAFKVMAALFSLPKSQLKILSVSDVHRDSRSMLAAIANNTGALTKFSYSGYMTPHETVLGVRGLVSGNPNLVQLDLKLQGKETAEPVNVYASTSEEEFGGTASYSGYEETSAPQDDDDSYFEISRSFRRTSRDINVDRDLAAVETHNIDRNLAAPLRNIDRELAEESNFDRELAIVEQRDEDEVCEEHLEDEEEDVYFERSEIPSDSDLVDFVRAVYMATDLRELTIQIPHHLIPEPPILNQAVAKACLPLRPRRVHVCIGNFYYLR